MFDGELFVAVGNLITAKLIRTLVLSSPLYELLIYIVAP